MFSDCIQKLIEFLNENSGAILKIVELIVPELMVAIIIKIIMAIYSKTKWSRRIKISEVFSTVLPNFFAPIAIELEKSERKGEQDSYFRGCMLKAILENPTERDISIARAWIIVDQVTFLDVRYLVFLGHVYKGKFRVYAVNNGSDDIKNVSISLQGSIYCGEEKKYFSNRQLGQLFCCQKNEFKYTISELRPGMIERICDFNVSKIELAELSEGTNWIFMNASFDYDSCLQSKQSFLASIQLVGDHIDSVYSEGASEDAKQYLIKIHGKDNVPQEKELPVDFNIKAKGSKQLQIITYADRSSTIQYHFRIKPAGGDIINSKMQSVNIEVPIYATDGGCYDTLREWLDINNYISYNLNQDMVKQREVLYQIPTGMNLNVNKD